MSNKTNFLSNSVIKGKISTKYGDVFFGRMWYDDDNVEEELKDIDVIWNLLVVPHGNVKNKIEIWFPISDFGIPSDIKKFIKNVDDIISQLKMGKKIFVHCYGGKGRTALALSALLVRLGSNGPDALSSVKSTLGPETEAQCQFVLDISNLNNL